MFISDYLVEHTTKQELQAIIYHEIGHIKKVHLPIRVLLLLSAYPIFVGLGSIMDMYLYDINIVFGLLIVCSSLILYGMLFLCIVRYQEYQADYYAIKECKDKHAYISALQKLQQLNDTLSKKSKARVLFSTHPTTENRIKRINKKFKD